MLTIDTIIRRLAGGLDRLARVGVVAMAIVIIANIIGRFFQHPIVGTYEIVEVLLALVVGLPLAYLGLQGTHIAVSILTDRLSEPARTIVKMFIDIFGVFLVALIAWQLFKYGTYMRVGGEVTETLKMPFYPVIYVLVFCFFVFFMVLLANLVKSVARLIRRKAR